MNLCYRYHSIFWNCACLIVDSGAAKEKESADYDKIAVAIGKIRSAGVKVVEPRINESNLTFAPDAEDNCIYYGFKGLAGVGDDVINEIIANRPYASVKDFVNRVKIKKPVMFSLIKAGAFDDLEPDRKFLMAWYIWEICDKKKRLTLQNMRMLIEKGLIPEGLSHEKTVFEFNRYLKAKCKTGENYNLDERALAFLENNYLDLYSEVLDERTLSAKLWDKQYYQKEMDNVREWLKENEKAVLETLNNEIFAETWNKYAGNGNISSWEMQSACFYFHDHELAHINKNKYNLIDFSYLPLEPRVERSFEKGGRTINMYELHRICGTVVAKDKDKGIVTIITPDNYVVPVKFAKDYFKVFDKQISVINETTGKKTVVEKSWFTRGNMIIVNGMRENDSFRAKKYASQGGHTLYKIKSIDKNGNVELQIERYKGGIEEDE